MRKLMLTLMAVTVALFFAPFAMTRWLGGGTDFWRGSGFFLCIGLGFMFVEIAWLQRFVLYLGHPSLATTAALGSMLLGAGLGPFCLRWASPVGNAGVHSSSPDFVAQCELVAHIEIPWAGVLRPGWG